MCKTKVGVLEMVFLEKLTNIDVLQNTQLKLWKKKHIWKAKQKNKQK